MKQFSTPGPRAIHPELCDSPSLGQCGVLANALFPRLIALADDQGRLAGGAQRVLVMALGNLLHEVRVDQVAEALDQLEGAGHLRQYQADGVELLQLSTWWRWQASQRRALPSRWAPPRGWHDLVYGVAASPHASFDDALAAAPRGSQAIRGAARRGAADRSAAPPRAQAPTQAPAQGGAQGGARAGCRAMPCRRRSARANGAEGAPSPAGPVSAGTVLSEFAQRVPRPGGDDR